MNAQNMSQFKEKISQMAIKIVINIVKQITEEPHGPCVLPLRPGRKGSLMTISPSAGKRFGSSPTSRQEYGSLPEKFKHR